jgi:hypothetical protein
MRLIIIVLICFYIQNTHAQKNIPTTDQFIITGNIVMEKTITISDLNKYPSFKIKKFRIINHAGEKKEWLKKCKGVKLRDVLITVELDANQPKQFSEYYFVLIASDGYKVTYSWNEIFNKKSGENIYILTEKDKTPISDMAGKIILVNPNDVHTGRRYIKGLSTIEVKKG